MSRQVYVNREGNHSKYWTIELDESSTTVNVTSGKIGTLGLVQPPKTFDTAVLADKFVSKKVAEKLKKGYTLITAEEFLRLTV